MATSRAKKARKEMTVSTLDAPGLEDQIYMDKVVIFSYLVVTQQTAMDAAMTMRQVWKETCLTLSCNGPRNLLTLRILASDMPRWERMEKKAEPTMMQTMKQEKTMPSGVEPVSSTGVHRKTKMYMQDSSRDWTTPSSRTFSSWKMILEGQCSRIMWAIALWTGEG